MTETVTTTQIDDLLKHREWLRRLAHHLVHESSVEDVVQDTCVRALGHGVPEDRPARPWLATVMRNVVRMNRRTSERRERRERTTQESRSTSWSPEELVDRVRLERALARMVTELEEPYRTTVLLRYYEGLSSADIGRSQGVAPATIRWRLKQGLERLRTTLDAEHDGQRSRWHAAWVPITLPPAGFDFSPATGSTLATAGKGVSGIQAGLLVTAALATLTATGWTVAATVDGVDPDPAEQANAVTPTAEAEGRQPVSNDEIVTEASPPFSDTARRMDSATRANLLKRIHTRRRDGSAPSAESVTGAGFPAAHRSSSAEGSDEPRPPGEIDKDYIRQQMLEILPIFKECYEMSLESNPGLAGRITVDFTIVGEPEIGGLVESCEYNAEKSTIVDAALIECVQESVYTLEFPPPDHGGTITVTYPIVFEDRED